MARIQMVTADRDCVNSDMNRYYQAGTEGYMTDLDIPIWLGTDGKWRNAGGTTYTPTIMSQTATILANMTTAGVTNPAGADLNKLDRAVYRMVKGGIFAKGRVRHQICWSSVSPSAITWAGWNIFQQNVCDPTGHPYHITLPGGRWTAGRGLLGDGTAYRLATTFNPSAAPSGGWTDPTEGTVVGGVFQAFISTSCYDHGLVAGTPSNGYEWCSDNAKAGVRSRSQSGAQSRMNAAAKSNFTDNNSNDPHMSGALRDGTGDSDHYNIDNGDVDSLASDTTTYHAEYLANIGLPDTFYYCGGKTSASSTIQYCDRTIGHGAIFTKLTLDEILLYADIDREWATSDGFYA